MQILGNLKFSETEKKIYNNKSLQKKGSTAKGVEENRKNAFSTSES